MRCRPGIIPHTAFATVPDQRCTASLSLALHRIRDTSPLNLASMGLDPRIHHSSQRGFAKQMDRQSSVQPGETVWGNEGALTSVEIYSMNNLH